MNSPLRTRFAVAAALLAFFLSCLVPSVVFAQAAPSSPEAEEQGETGELSQPGSTETVLIPGPLRSFLRMAAISQEASPDQVMALLARNAAMQGYQGDRPTEYLVLVERYVHQARELHQLADANGMIRVSGCDDAARLIQVLGYKFQHLCRPGNVSLVTASAERAFLTIDSGFPLTALEQALAAERPFEYSYPSTRVPILFKEKNWAGVSIWIKGGGESLLDELLHDRVLDRLYAGMANCDQETRAALLRSPGLRRLANVAMVFDQYGREISIRSGVVRVPPGSEKAWEELAGASLHAPGEFVMHLLSNDNGWLAAYFDAVSRQDQAQQAHLADEGRLKRLYNAYRSTAAASGAARGVYPRNAELLVLLSSLKWEPNGELEVPGGIGAWREILAAKARSRGSRSYQRWSRCCSNPEALLETLVAAANFHANDDPAQIYLALVAMNGKRASERSLSDAVEGLIATRLSQFNRWFPVFAEFPALDDDSIAQFIHAADSLEGISSPALRANALGAFQAEIGLWQIFARQGQIPKEQLNLSWQKAIQPYLGINSSVQLFEAARSSLNAILQPVAGNSDLAQDQIIESLAGPAQETKDGEHVHREIATRIRSVLNDQRLASLDALFGLYDGLTQMAHGKPAGANLLAFAESLREFEVPRPIFTGGERVSWSPIVYTSRHAELQVRTDLTKIIRSSASPAQLESARGQLAPFLRDTLVGLNYAYYEPPGAEVLHNNPLFIRSHDFSSISVQGVRYTWGVPELIGVGATAGGGAYLMGSLADLPYALAITEEDFIAPKNVQALIWKEVVPQLLVSAIVPRWWSVSQNELHAAALYQRAGEEIYVAAASDRDLRDTVLEVLSDRMTPDELEHFQSALKDPGDAKAAAQEIAPADTFYLASETRARHRDQFSHLGHACDELETLARTSPSDFDPGRIAADFGVPHPTMQRTNSSGLLNLKPVSAFGGIESDLLAESWQSNNLYWARLADEMGYSPVMLNLLVPTLTRRMVANIFASNIDDLPALARAMRETGDEFRQGKIAFDSASNAGGNQP